MKKKLFLISIILTHLLFLTSCSDEDENEEDDYNNDIYRENTFERGSNSSTWENQKSPKQYNTKTRAS